MTDSLTGHMAIAADSLTAGSAAMADSISVMSAVDLGAVTDSAYVALCPVMADPAAEIFGSQSLRVDGMLDSVAGSGFFAGNVLFQLVLLGLLFFYLYTVLACRTETALLMRLVTGTNRERRPVEEYRNILSSYTNRMIIAGFAGAGMAAARLMDVRMSAGGMLICEKWASAPALIVITVAAVVMGLSIAQYLLLKGVGRLTLSEKTVGKLLWQKTIFVAAGGVVMIPLVLLAGLAPQFWATIFIYAYLITGAAFILGFSRSTYKLFVKQKVSILFWILYLCAVELMPYAILVIAVLRNTGF